MEGPQRFPIIVHQGKLKYLYIDVNISFDPSYKKDLVINQIKEIIGISGDETNGIDGSKGLFGIKNRSFGMNEYSSNVEAVIQNVQGVLWVKVTAMDLLSDADSTEDILYPPSTKVLNSVINCGSERILCLYKNHFMINSVSVEMTGECQYG